MAKKYRKIWNSKEEYEAREAALNERMARFKALLDKAQAEIERRKAEQASAADAEQVR